MHAKEHTSKTITIVYLASLICLLSATGGLSSEIIKDDKVLGQPAGQVGDFGLRPHFLGAPTIPEQDNGLEHNNLGVILGMKGSWDEAIKEHEAALMAEPTNKVFRVNLSSVHLRYGKSLLQKQDYPNAENQFRRAMFVDPNNLEAKKGLDECLKKSHVPRNRN
ncbi:MAG: hypothetical protein C5B53_12245 [Candidatus Melainabacteria bacterium]|nr:MAG: hypothetical protein C5B53_12245 [Candidatus Melainabacteria bacterium]